MKTNRLRKVLAVVLTTAVVLTSVNVNILKADETSPVEEKYAAITDLYKTVDETIELLIKRADNDEMGERTYFVKSKEETLDTSWWANIVDRRSGENIYLAFRSNKCVYTFKLGEYYYHTLRIDIYRAYTTSEDKKEYEEKVKYVEEKLGLFSEEMCNYEKAAIIYKYIVDSVEYGRGLYNGKTKSELIEELGYDGYLNFINEENYTYDKLYLGQTAYEAIKYGEAVCGGYSRLYASMLTDMNINNIWITSRELENSHAWNLVEMGDKWYYCDPTAADPTNSNTITSNEEGFIYLSSFMCGILEDVEIPFHVVDTESYKTIDYYNCIVSEETMRYGDDGKGSSRVSLAKIYNYTAPTCTETGYYDIGCDYCNDRHEIIIPVTHYYTYTTTDEATCNKDGSGVATCTLCGDSYEYTIPKKEHKWNYAYQEANCETDGYEKVYCEECEANYWIEETKAYVHDWSDWFEASLTQYAKECSKCGERVYELKKVIDGLETTTVYISDEDTTPMDRGFGIVAYYDPERGFWVYEHPDWGECYLDGETGVRLPTGELVLWDEETHTFYKYNENSETPSVSLEETSSTFSSEDETKEGETDTTPFTSINDNEPTTTVNEENTTTVAPTTTAKKVVTPPAKTSVKSASKKKTAKSVKVSIKKVKYAKGYRVQFSTTKNFKKVLVSKYVKKTNTTISNNKLKNKKKLYVRVKAYKLNGKKKIWAKTWSKVKTVKVKL